MGSGSPQLQDGRCAKPAAELAAVETVVTAPATRTPRSPVPLAIVSLLVVVIIGVFVLIALRPDPVQTRLDQVDAALAAGDRGRALTTADALIAEFPEDARGHEAVRAVIAAEVASLLNEQRHAEALQLVATRKQERSWLDISTWDRDIRIAHAQYLTSQGNHRGAAEIYDELFQLYPTDRVSRRAQLADYGRRGDELPSRFAVYTAWRLTELEDGPLDDLVGGTLIYAPNWFGTWSDDSAAVRDVLLERYREPTLAAAHYTYASDDVENRIEGFKMLTLAGELDQAEQLRFHAWMLFGNAQHYSTQFKESLAWIDAAIASAEWEQIKATAAFEIPLEPPSILERWSDTQQEAGALMLRGFMPELAARLQTWIASDDAYLRWNALLMLQEAGLADDVDLWAFHERTLTSYDRTYRPHSVEEAIAFFTQAEDRERARAALRAGREYVAEFIERVTANGMARHAQNATAILEQIDAVLSAP